MPAVIFALWMILGQISSPHLSQQPAYPSIGEAEKPYIPTLTDDARFPVRVRIISEKDHYDGLTFYGSGRLRLAGATRDKGYSFRCAQDFIENVAEDEYRGRWKARGRKLQLLLLQNAGSRQTRRCTVTLK